MQDAHELSEEGVKEKYISECNCTKLSVQKGKYNIKDDAFSCCSCYCCKQGKITDNHFESLKQEKQRNQQQN